MKETAIQRQRVEHEADEMRADHLKTVSAVKAELTAKIRQLKVIILLIYLIFKLFFYFV